MKIFGSQYFENILLVFKSPWSLLWWLIAWFIVGVLWWYFMDFDLIIWNQWHVVAYTELSLFFVFVLLFSVFVSISIYKILYFRSGDARQIWLWWVGWFLSLLVMWCPACSITLASYIWLASILSLLPYNGLELKVIWIVFLVYACIVSLRSLQTCALQEKNWSAYDIQHLVRVWVIVLWFLICVRAIADYWMQ